MLKRCLAILVGAMMISSLVSAEKLTVGKNFDPAVISYNRSNAKIAFENEDIRIEVLRPGFQGFGRHTKGIIFYNELISDSSIKIMRQDNLTTMDADYVHYECVGASFAFTNKKAEPMYLDLNSSAISIGSYYGKPVLSGTRFSDAQSAAIPPLVIMPNQTVKKFLSRGDYEFVPASLFYRADWKITAEDFALDSNIFGDGNFIFTIGLNEKKMIPMNFYLEAESASVKNFADPKKQEGLEKFKIKMQGK